MAIDDATLRPSADTAADDGTPRREPVELRIHGVGGTTPAELLGVEGPHAVRRVGAGPVSAFWRRRPDDRGREGHLVEGYVWGGLTSQATFQPLWLLLLPFTLVNAAGWMHRSVRTSWIAGAMRRLIGLVGFALTVTWTLWVATLVIEYGAWAWIGPRWPAALRLALGAAVSGALVFAICYVARHTTREFEGVNPPDDHVRDTFTKYSIEDPAFWEQRSAWRRPAGGQPRSSWTDKQIGVHITLAVATLAWVVGVAGYGIASGTVDDGLGLGRLLVPAAAVNLALLVALAAVSTVDTWWPRQSGEGSVLDRPRRVIGPATACAMAVGISWSGFSGLALVVAEATGVADARTRPEQLLADVAGAAALVTAICVAALVVVHLFVRGPSITDVPVHPSDAPPAAPLQGVPHEGWLRKVGRRRRLALVLGRLGWVLAPPAAAFAALSVVKLLPGGRIGSWQALLDGTVTPVACAGATVGATLRWLASSCGGPGAAPTWLAAVGALLVATAATAGPAFLWRAARSPRLRHSVGVLWDVLTFWPRWHHPFAVRCYAERAVPELQCRIAHFIEDEQRPVVISAHSQGTVLATAALAGLSDATVADVDVVTFGSPLTTLYARFFPAYFGRETDYAEVRGRVASWTNFYRTTDYVGQRIAGLAEDENIELPDPIREQGDGSADDAPLGLSAAMCWADEQWAPAWTTISAHSFYRREPRLRSAVTDAVEAAATRPRPAPSPAAVPVPRDSRAPQDLSLPGVVGPVPDVAG